MTSGTANESKLGDILSENIIFPTESVANPNNEDNTNNNNFEEEEDEAEDEELKEPINEEEETIDIKHPKDNDDDKTHIFQIQQEQIFFQLANEDKDQKSEDNETEKPPDEEINAVSEQFLKGEKIKANNPILLAYVVTDLENKRDQLMIDGDFQNSIKAQKAVDAARSKHLEAVKKQTSKEQLKIIEKKQSKLKSKYEKFEEQMKQEEDKLEEEIREQTQILNDRHQLQILEHDEKWQEEAKQKHYNRASQRLRVLRTQQQLLMNAKRFDEAEQVCKIADGVAQQEALESHKQMLTAYKNSRRKLEEKQADEMDTFLRTCEQKREILQHQKDVLSRPFFNRINNLSREKKIAQDPDRLWILKHRNDDKKVNTLNAAPKNTKTTQPQTQSLDQEKKKEAFGFNKLDLPPLFESSTPITSHKKRKENASNRNASPQKINSTQQNPNHPTLKSNQPSKPSRSPNRKANPLPQKPNQPNRPDAISPE